ncbi:hypothetical protein B0H12DRAFT_120426 [Mycena haematopus]|nr:hypothetical protein B0H12DRAFT_120426 [Mycena haematopus]
MMKVAIVKKTATHGEQENKTTTFWRLIYRNVLSEGIYNTSNIPRFPTFTTHPYCTLISIASSSSMAEILAKVAVDLALPPLVALVKDQIPKTTANKWDTAVSEAARILRTVTLQGTPLPDPDVDRFMLMVSDYRGLQRMMEVLVAAHKRGAWNYFKRRQIAKDMADIGRKAVKFAETTSTTLVIKQLCKSSGHPDPCNICS